MKQCHHNNYPTNFPFFRDFYNSFYLFFFQIWRKRSKLLFCHQLYIDNPNIFFRFYIILSTAVVHIKTFNFLIASTDLFVSRTTPFMTLTSWFRFICKCISKSWEALYVCRMLLMRDVGFIDKPWSIILVITQNLKMYVLYFVLLCMIWFIICKLCVCD